MIIREFRSEDISQIEDCYIELQDYLRLLEPDMHEGTFIVKKYLEYMFSECEATNGKVFVAELEDKIVGFVSIWAKVESDAVDEKTTEYAFISDIVVLPGYRGKGIGSTLMAKAEGYAVSQGAKTIRLAVLAKNDTARSLYNNYGFKDHLIIMRKNCNSE
jgi:ribosomal protein S18 acetylase RimI-like enzyme